MIDELLLQFVLAALRVAARYPMPHRGLARQALRLAPDDAFASPDVLDCN